MLAYSGGFPWRVKETQTAFQNLHVQKQMCLNTYCVVKDEIARQLSELL